MIAHDQPGCVLLRQASTGKWLLFQLPLEILIARTVNEVEHVLAAVENSVASGKHAAGFVSYEAAPAMDKALVTHIDTSGFPLAWFGIYGAPQVIEELPIPCATEDLNWVATIDETEYAAKIERVKACIAAGTTYQVNYTLRLEAKNIQLPWQLFLNMVSAQGGGYSGWLNSGEWSICSASPEMFFEVNGNEIVSRPMKGTAARGFGAADDLQRKDELVASLKERAENVMIVDMVRNDIGRVAETGSVVAEPVCQAERYPTVWQLTSTVRGKTCASFTEIMKALFPAASITGAPKASTMRIIAELENTPRRIYTGAIGYIAPGRRAQFSVAIRTVMVDNRSKSGEYGVGGGIIWDAKPALEWGECQIKARVLTAKQPQFDLLETFCWQPWQEEDSGYVLLYEHLSRLALSAEYFNYKFDRQAVVAKLISEAAQFSLRPYRVRLLLRKNGELELTSKVMSELPASYRVIFAHKPVCRKNHFLYHKTTERKAFELALAQLNGIAEDVIWYNEEGEITESCIANLFVDFGGGKLATPPVACGLLPGVMRKRLLDEGRAVERIIHKEEMLNATRIYLANSVRGLWEIKLLHG